MASGERIHASNLLDKRDCAHVGWLDGAGPEYRAGELGPAILSAELPACLPARDAGWNEAADRAERRPTAGDRCLCAGRRRRHRPTNELSTWHVRRTDRLIRHPRI